MLLDEGTTGFNKRRIRAVGDAYFCGAGFPQTLPEAWLHT